MAREITCSLQSYRERFSLPVDYPMVAPSYSEQRSALALRIGLGRPDAAAAEEPNPAPVEVPAAPKARGLRKKAEAAQLRCQPRLQRGPRKVTKRCAPDD